MKPLLLFAFLLPWAASAQSSDCAFNTGNNASIFLMKDAYRSLHPGDVVRVHAEVGCVGETVLPDDNALAYAVTAWGDDEITGAVDGAVAGELLALSLTKKASTAQLDVEGAFADNLAYGPDRLYKVTFAEFDTTTTRELAELNADIERVGAELDTAYAIADVLNAQLLVATGERDSLQTLVDAQLANILDLQSQLTAANATIDSLETVIANMPNCSQCESDLLAARSRIAELEQQAADTNTELVAARQKIAQIAAVAASNKGRFGPILDILRRP